VRVGSGEFSIVDTGGGGVATQSKCPFSAFSIYIFQQARGAIQSKRSFYAFAKYIFQQEGGEASKKNVQDQKRARAG
jgi:hypothetical protein